VIKAPIHIALTFDDNFWAPAYTTMRSVCRATHRRTDLVFHLCHRKLTQEHTKDLNNIADEFGATLCWYNIDEMAQFSDIAGRARYNQRLSNIVYARLLFAEILPKSITRLVYLDCDTYIIAPIENLAELDMKDLPIAAVQDHLALYITGGRDILANRDLFDPADPYFNAGILLIDMQKWRDAQVVNRLEQAMANGTMDRIYYDQDLLNLIFQNNWLKLDPRWNMMDPRKDHEAMRPYILHYTDKRKPWNLISINVAYASAYRRVTTSPVHIAHMRHRWHRQFKKLVGMS